MFIVLPALKSKGNKTLKLLNNISYDKAKLVSRRLNRSVWQSGDAACVVRRESNETEELSTPIKSQIYTKTDLASHIQSVSFPLLKL